jgi:hypothetical protein
MSPEEARQKRIERKMRAIRSAAWFVQIGEG